MVRRLALLFVVALGALVAGVAPASAASDWTLVRNEQFSSSALPKGCQAYTGAYEAGANTWATGDVRLTAGQLRLRLEKKGKAFTAGGVGCYDWGQAYGRYEVRATVPAGAGLDSFIALWPESATAAANGWTGVELVAPTLQTANITNGYGTGNQTAQVPGRYAGAAHNYVIEWAPNGTRVLVDGRVIFADPRSFAGRRWLGLTLSTGEELTGLPTAATKLPAELRIDSVRVWTYTGKAKAVAPSATPSATVTADPNVPGSVELTKAPAVAVVAPEVKPDPDLGLVAVTVVAALLSAAIGFGVVRFVIRRRS